MFLTLKWGGGGARGRGKINRFINFHEFFCLLENMEDAVFKIKAIDGKGNGLVAIRDLDPGEVVFVEEAAAVGPASPTSCLECLKVKILVLTT